MAAASGDMRRALEASTAALELKVQEAVAEQADLTANALDPGAHMTGQRPWYYECVTGSAWYRTELRQQIGAFA